MHVRSTARDDVGGTTSHRRWARRLTRGGAGLGGIVARAGALGAALALVTTAAAGAHPGLRPDEVPNGSATEAEIVIPHGCGAEGGVPEDEADPSPTTQVALQWPDGVEVLPGGVDGWATSVHEGVTTWDDDGGATTEPVVLPVTVQVAADVAPGAVDVSVYQECANGESLRWQAGPDEEGSPALRMTVVAGAPRDDPAGTPTAPAATASTAAPSPVATPAPTSDATSDVTPPAVTGTPAASATASPTVAAAGDDESDAGTPWWVPVVAVAVVLLAALPLVNRDRSPRRDTGGGA